MIWNYDEKLFYGLEPVYFLPYFDISILRCWHMRFEAPAHINADFTRGLRLNKEFSMFLTPCIVSS